MINKIQELLLEMNDKGQETVLGLCEILANNKSMSRQTTQEELEQIHREKQEERENEIKEQLTQAKRTLLEYQPVMERIKNESAASEEIGRYYLSYEECMALHYLVSDESEKIAESYKLGFARGKRAMKNETIRSSRKSQA